MTNAGETDMNMTVKLMMIVTRSCSSGNTSLVDIATITTIHLC